MTLILLCLPLVDVFNIGAGSKSLLMYEPPPAELIVSNSLNAGIDRSEPVTSGDEHRLPSLDKPTPSRLLENSVEVLKAPNASSSPFIYDCKMQID